VLPQSWRLLLHFQTTVGGLGCQQQVKRGDDVLCEFVNSVEEVSPLKHSGPMPVQAVTDGRTGKPVDGAEVNGQNSNSCGQATITLSSTGGFASALPSRSRPKRMVLFDRIDISSTSFRRSPKGPEVAQRGVMNCTSSIIMLSSLSFS